MKTTAGVWIDHRKAVIVMAWGEEEKTLEILSNVEKHPGHLAGAHPTAPFEAQKVKADDNLEQEFTLRINQYYDKVIDAIHGAESILIFGPGEAKGEFKKRLDHAKLGEHVVALETADKMTDRQIAAKIRDHFQHLAVKQTNKTV
jgi:hypothetical protein